ncbi:hypothetical protein EVJ58_g10747, partial [Rhodofomes roseus]
MLAQVPADKQLEQWVEAVESSDLFQGGLTADKDWELGRDGLKREVGRCKQFSRTGVALDFATLIGVIKLVLRYRRIESKTEGGTKSVRQLHKDDLAKLCPHDKPALRTLQDWIRLGIRCGVLAAGGTVDCLVLVSAYNLKSELNRLNEAAIAEVANWLRAPQPGTVMGDLVINRIIPVVEQLHKRLHGAVLFKDIPGNDELLKPCLDNTFDLCDRDATYWAGCLAPLMADSNATVPAATPVKDAAPAQAWTITMSFSAAATPKPSDLRDAWTGEAWTELERSRAARA